jgi:hypothetical protein
MTGMVMLGSPRVPGRRSVRSGAFPSLKMTTRTAPAAWAFAAFSPKVQVPRWITAMFPAGKLAKSLASQPLVDPPTGGITGSMTVIGAVTSPEPE